MMTPRPANYADRVNVKSPKTGCSFLLKLACLLILLFIAPGIASAVPLIATDGTNLIRFDSGSPGTVSAPVPITGLNAGETIVGIDYRPSTGILYGLAYDAGTTTARLVAIVFGPGGATATANQAGPTFSLTGTAFGFDFNPTVDRVRVTNDNDQNLSIDPDTGAVTLQTPLNYAGADPNFGQNPNVVGSAYNNVDVDTATGTTLYGIDSNLDILVTQNPPASGTLTTIGALGVDTSDQVGFDIAPPVFGGSAFASMNASGTTGLYTIDLTTGAATLVGSIDTGAVPYPGLAVVLGGNFIVNTNTDASDADTGDGVCDTDLATAGSQCTLRAAIEQANADAGSNNINFASSVTGTITLTLGELSITSPDGVAISGPGARVLTVSGNNVSRVFNVQPGAAATISGLTISNGLINQASLLIPVIGGGGISNSGDLTITDVTVSNNAALGTTSLFAPTPNAFGGGILNTNSLVVVRSTISNNSATGGNAFICPTFPLCLTGNAAGSGTGGGIVNVGFLDISNSTISGNTATGGNGLSTVPIPALLVPGNANGGGIGNISSGVTQLRSVTISNNTATAGTTTGFPIPIVGTGGGVANPAGTVDVGNTIIAGNRVGPPPSIPIPTSPDVSGSFTSAGYNLVGKVDGSAGFAPPLDQVGTVAVPLNPKLGPLANHGGPTDTHNLLPDSPAVDLGKNGIAPAAPDATDQRGKPRTFNFNPAVGPAVGGDETDIGAFELQALNQAPVNTVPGPQATNEDTPLVFSSGNGNQISISDPDAGANPVQVSLTATNGTLTLSNTAGLTFTVGDGTNDANMTFTGTITDINAALNGLTFTPTANYNGPATLTITTNDQGNTGDPLPLSDTDVVNITVNPVNDAPVAVNDAYATVEDQTLTVPAPGVLTNDTDIDSPTLTATLVTGPSNASSFTLNPNGSFTYTPNTDFSGVDTFTYRASDGTDQSNIATVTITVNALPRLNINDVSVVEGNSGVANAVFTVTLSFPSTAPVSVTVEFITTDGTATSPGDYQARTGTRTFAPGETVKTISVPVNGDTQPEPDETFFVVLADPVNAKLADGVGMGTIIDDDTARVDLSAATYSVSEGAGSFNITVTRTIAQTAASIDYATSDSSGLNNCDQVTGFASQRCDYEIGVGTLHFAFGEFSKTISIPVIDDVYVEGPETLTLTLSNPVGLNPGTITSATLTITDNDVAPGAANPIDNTNFFVRQLYLDFLNREPDPPGFAAWTQLLNTCAPGNTSCDRLAIAGGFYLSPEFRDRVYFIYKFYAAAFGRKPQYDEFMNDRARVSGFKTASELEQARLDFIANFINRPEFHSIYDSTTNTQFVDTVAFRAGVTLSNRDALIAQLQSGQKTRAEVLRAIVEGPEVDSKFFNESTIVMHYFALLRRDPDALYQTWVTIFQNTGSFREVTNGFINSPEYRARFGQ
jgi:Domain of unknown function (DUF4394)/Bacterial Ig domain/Calx-beta domain/Domain of unknown function (DUF4214)